MVVLFTFDKVIIFLVSRKMLSLNWIHFQNGYNNLKVGKVLGSWKSTTLYRNWTSAESWETMGIVSDIYANLIKRTSEL